MELLSTTPGPAYTVQSLELKALKFTGTENNYKSLPDTPLSGPSFSGPSVKRHLGNWLASVGYLQVFTFDPELSSHCSPVLV